MKEDELFRLAAKEKLPDLEEMRRECIYKGKKEQEKKINIKRASLIAAVFAVIITGSVIAVNKTNGGFIKPSTEYQIACNQETQPVSAIQEYESDAETKTSDSTENTEIFQDSIIRINFTEEIPQRSFDYTVQSGENEAGSQVSLIKNVAVPYPEEKPEVSCGRVYINSLPSSESSETIPMTEIAIENPPPVLECSFVEYGYGGKRSLRISFSDNDRVYYDFGINNGKYETSVFYGVNAVILSCEEKSIVAFSYNRSFYLVESENIELDCLTDYVRNLIVSAVSDTPVFSEPSDSAGTETSSVTEPYSPEGDSSAQEVTTPAVPPQSIPEQTENNQAEPYHGDGVTVMYSQGYEPQ